MRKTWSGKWYALHFLEFTFLCYALKANSQKPDFFRDALVIYFHVESLKKPLMAKIYVYNSTINSKSV